MKSKISNTMLEEIAEQPAIFADIMSNREKISADFVNLLLSKNIKRIYFSGSGSPSNIAIIAKYAATKLLKIEATYSYPTLFNNHEGFNVGDQYAPDEMLLICPAESGRTKGPVIAARKAKEIGMSVMCTTHNPTGVLARECDVVVTKPSGREVALPSTKGHSTGIFLLLLCFVEGAKALGTISEDLYKKYIDGFERLSNSCDDARKKTVEWFYDNQELLMLADQYHIVAYGANFGTIMEARLKFIESHLRPTMVFELEEFMHGPIRSIRSDDVVLFLVTEDGPERERMLRLFNVIKEYTDKCVLIQGAEDAVEDPLALIFDAVNIEFLNTLEFLVPIQVLSFLISYHLGLDMTERKTLSIKAKMEPSFTD